MKPNATVPIPVSRRQFFRDGSRLAAMTGIGGLLGVLAGRSVARGTVWQIDPQKCVRCGLCATSCVLEQSAVNNLATVVNGDGDGCRSRDAFIHVYDGAVNAIETHQHKDEFKAW